MTDNQKQKKFDLAKLNLKTARAYNMRSALQDVYESSDTVEEATRGLKKLCSWMIHSRLEPMNLSSRVVFLTTYQVFGILTGHSIPNAL